MSGALIIRRCASAEEAAVVCALLNDAGIPASLENWHHAMIDWGALQALGGVGVLVPAGRVSEARQVIIDYVQSAEERLRNDFPDLETESLTPDRFRQFILIGYYTGALLIPFIILFMLIEVVSQVSAGGLFSWDMVAERLASAQWGYLLGYVGFAALYFLVPFIVLVFLSHRFLTRRSELKATP